MNSVIRIDIPDDDYLLYIFDVKICKNLLRENKGKKNTCDIYNSSLI